MSDLSALLAFVVRRLVRERAPVAVSCHGACPRPGGFAKAPVEESPAAANPSLHSRCWRRVQPCRHVYPVLAREGLTRIFRVAARDMRRYQAFAWISPVYVTAIKRGGGILLSSLLGVVLFRSILHLPCRLRVSGACLSKEIRALAAKAAFACAREQSGSGTR